MEVIITDTATGKTFKIEPADDEYQYKLMIKNDGSRPKAKKEWLFTGKYPLDIARGVELAIGYCLSEEDGFQVDVEFDSKETKSIVSAVNKIRQEIRERVMQICGSES